MKQKCKKFQTILIVILSTLLIAIISLNVWINTSHNWGNEPYEITYIDIPQNLARNVPKRDLKQLIDNLFNQPHFYRERADFKEFGKTIILFRSITINSNLDSENYALTYAHELTHLKYMCANETFTAYKTFVILYESGNEILQNVAERYACRILRGDWKGTPYDIGYYILGYFEGK